MQISCINVSLYVIIVLNCRDFDPMLNEKKRAHDIRREKKFFFERSGSMATMDNSKTYDIIRDREHFFKMIQLLEKDFPSTPNFIVSDSNERTIKLSNIPQQNCIYAIRVAKYDQNNKIEVDMNGQPIMTNIYGGKTEKSIETRLFGHLNKSFNKFITNPDSHDR